MRPRLLASVLSLAAAAVDAARLPGALGGLVSLAPRLLSMLSLELFSPLFSLQPRGERGARLVSAGLSLGAALLHVDTWLVTGSPADLAAAVATALAAALYAAPGR